MPRGSRGQGVCRQLVSRRWHMRLAYLPFCSSVIGEGVERAHEGQGRMLVIAARWALFVSAQPKYGPALAPQNTLCPPPPPSPPRPLPEDLGTGEAPALLVIRAEGPYQVFDPTSGGGSKSRSLPSGFWLRIVSPCIGSG